MRPEKAIGRIGVLTVVNGGGECRTGRSVIYPLRRGSGQWSGVEQTPEGRADVLSYMMFCEKALLQNAGYGSLITAEGSKYVLIWKDDYLCGLGGYARACIRKMTEEEENAQ